jgi:phosphate-selective porin
MLAPASPLAHTNSERRTRVRQRPTHHAADSRLIVDEVAKVMTHVRLLCCRRRPCGEVQARAWRKASVAASLGLGRSYHSMPWHSRRCRETLRLAVSDAPARNHLR